ncbi:CD109 antigen-like isoform X2 [Eriocheir sinensis]|nr:CD109 antigen-like isoform X2 [Eriocheir sinensis]
MIRPASVYRVVIGVLQGKERLAGQIEVRASLSTLHDRQMAQAHHSMRFGETKSLIMKAPEDIGSASGGDGLKLKVEGRMGSQVLFSNTTHVAVTTRFLTMLVQMSRPLYTGSQRIEFRVVLLRTDMRPYQGPVHVYVLDTDGFVVKRWLSRFPSTGVVELKMGTPGLPKFGWWRVKVVAGSQVHYHPFYITKYFAPRFEVLVETPFFTVASDGALSGRFGGFFLTYMPVEGSANVTVFVKEHWNLPDSNYREVFMEEVGYVNGWTDFRYPLTRLQADNHTRDLSNAEVKVLVSVKHTFMGDIYSGHAKTRLVSPGVKLAFVGSAPLVFKPGMTLSSAVAVSYEDGEALEEDKLLQSTLTISASVTLASGVTAALPKIVAEPINVHRLIHPWDSSASYGHNLSSDSLLKDTIVEDNLAQQKMTKGNLTYPSDLEDTMWLGKEEARKRIHSALTHHAAFVRYHRDGILEFTLEIPEGATGINIHANYRDSEGEGASASIGGDPVHSPKGRYLHITTSTETATVGEFAIFHIRANFPMDWFQYMVMAKGMLVHSETEQVKWSGWEVVTTLSIAIAREMSPRFTLVVMHVTPDNHVLVDTIHVSVKFHYSSRVEVELNQHKDHSKKTVEASMRAAPGTLLALTCTRWPGWLAHHASRITPARLLKAVLQMEPHPRSVHTVRRRSRSGSQSERVEALSAESTGQWPLASLHQAGLTILTDAVLSSPRHFGRCDHQMGFLECGDGTCYRQTEVCDGYAHCHNEADELHCLAVAQEYQQPGNSTEGRLPITPELEEEQFRLTHRSWWRDLFDQKEGSWCLTHTYFGHKGYQRVELDVPHSPGKWVVEGFATHNYHGLHILSEQSYDATPPLLMKVEAPSVCRRGEQIAVRVHLYNSQTQAMMVMVVLEGSKDHRFVHVERDASVSHFSPRLSSGDHQHLITLKGGKFKEVNLPLAVMRQAGDMTITVRALSQLGQRTATLKVKVQPEGAEVRKHTSVLLDLKSRAVVYEFFNLPVDQSPEISKSILRRFVYGSPRASVTVSGDVFGPVRGDAMLNFQQAFKGRFFKSSDGLNFNFGATVWTLHYLRLTNQLSTADVKKAFQFLNVQLAGLLTRFDNGSFKMWHFSKPSVWVTAWTLKTILAAQLEDWENLVYVEPRLVTATIDFLIQHQAEDGSFHETEHYRNTTLSYTMAYKGLAGTGFEDSEDKGRPLVALTSLIVTVLSEALPTVTGDVHGRAVSAKLRAITFLERSLDKLWDPYDVSITTYALTVGASTEKEVALKILEAMAKKSNEGGLHWAPKKISSNTRLAQDNQRSFLLPKEPQEWDAYAVEATSYALLTYLLREGVTPRVESIVRWLTSVRDWDMAFSSTVDTVLAMQALAEYSHRARLRDVTRLDVHIEASSMPDFSEDVSITNRSISARHSFQVPRPWGHVFLEAKGSGQAVAQMDITWGVDLDRYLEKPPRKYFDLTVTETYPHFRNKSVINTTICTKWTALEVSPVSHAAYLEVEVATGYFIAQPVANKIVKDAMKSSFPELIDVKVSQTLLSWQFSYVPSDKMNCFSYTLRRHFPAANLTSVRFATIFELYAPEHFETIIINSTNLAALDICEVCGSYQCPYCPYYSGKAPSLRPCLLTLILSVLLLSAPPLVDSVRQKRSGDGDEENGDDPVGGGGGGGGNSRRDKRSTKRTTEASRRRPGGHHRRVGSPHLASPRGGFLPFKRRLPLRKR